VLQLQGPSLSSYITGRHSHSHSRRTERMTSAKNMAWFVGRQLDRVLWQYWPTMLATRTNMLTCR